MRKILWGAVVLAGASLVATHGHGQTAVPTVHEAMKDVVAVQAAILWDASNGALDDDGNPAASKMTQAKWNQVTEAAARMRTAAMMLADNDPVAAAPGVKIQDEENSGAANAAQVQRYIDADKAGFQGKARALAATADGLAASAATKDVTKLVNVAGELDEVCESCHMAYWYPQQGR